MYTKTPINISTVKSCYLLNVGLAFTISKLFGLDLNNGKEEFMIKFPFKIFFVSVTLQISY